MKIFLRSKTTTGKLATISTFLFIVSMLLKQLTLGVLPLPIPIIALIGVIGFIFGVVSFVKNKDRSLMTLLSIIIGLLIIIWVTAEIAFPH